MTALAFLIFANVALCGLLFWLGSKHTQNNNPRRNDRDDVQ